MASLACPVQDTWDEFHKPTKKDERGTLRQLTNYFKHKTDSYDIIKNTANNFDFMQVIWDDWHTVAFKG